ncbi:MAG: hypothetical protein OXC65_09085 [Thiotrichales bacterium]|nr:hypothetical protein [Thiotrichales bacterium]
MIPPLAVTKVRVEPVDSGFGARGRAATTMRQSSASSPMLKALGRMVTAPSREGFR